MGDREPQPSVEVTPQTPSPEPQATGPQVPPGHRDLQHYADDTIKELEELRKNIGQIEISTASTQVNVQRGLREVGSLIRKGIKAEPPEDLAPGLVKILQKMQKMGPNARQKYIKENLDELKALYGTQTDHPNNNFFSALESCLAQINAAGIEHKQAYKDKREVKSNNFYHNHGPHADSFKALSKKVAELSKDASKHLNKVAGKHGVDLTSIMTGGILEIDQTIKLVAHVLNQLEELGQKRNEHIENAQKISKDIKDCGYGSVLQAWATTDYHDGLVGGKEIMGMITPEEGSPRLKDAIVNLKAKGEELLEGHKLESADIKILEELQKELEKGYEIQKAQQLLQEDLDKLHQAVAQENKILRGRLDKVDQKRPAQLVGQSTTTSPAVTPPETTPEAAPEAAATKAAPLTTGFDTQRNRISIDPPAGFSGVQATSNKQVFFNDDKSQSFSVETSQSGSVTFSTSKQNSLKAMGEAAKKLENHSFTLKATSEQQAIDTLAKLSEGGFDYRKVKVEIRGQEPIELANSSDKANAFKEKVEAKINQAAAPSTPRAEL